MSGFHLNFGIIVRLFCIIPTHVGKMMVEHWNLILL